MAGGDEGRRSMDLNLHLGLPLSPIPHIPDLGSNLSLGSVSSPPPPLPVFDMTDAHTPYSPSHASFAPANIVVEEGEDGEDPVLADNPTVFPSSSLNLEFPPSSLPLRPIVVFPYSTSSYRNSPPEVGDRRVGDGAASHVPYFPPSFGIADESTGRDEDDTFLIRSYNHPPALTTTSTDPQVHAEVETYRPTPLLVDDVASQDGVGGGSSSRQDALQSSEFRFRSLIESEHRNQTRNREARRFRSSQSYRDRSVTFSAASFPASEQNLGVVLAERPFESSGKNKVKEDGINNDGLEEVEEEKSGNSVNFECNICYDVAKEPVVTSCGHLFCWPCLYQWLYHYSDHKECPACKGQIIEANITPIYGRGSSEDLVEGKIDGNNVDSDMKIPPRPRGRRFESLRQRIQRPISRRPGDGVNMAFRRFIGEELVNMGRLEGLIDPTLGVVPGRLEEGVSNTPRHDLDEGLQAGVRPEGQHLNHAMQQFVDHGNRLVSRYRARRLLATEDHEAGPIPAVNGMSRVATASTQPDVNPGSSYTNDGIDPLHRFPLDMAASERLHALRANFNMLVSTFSRNGSGRSIPSMLPVDLQNSEVPAVPAIPQNPTVVQRSVGGTQSADQASASSTMAVIQDDVGATDTSAEPNRAGSSSRSSRRRVRNNGSTTFDIDGILHTNKRRLN